MTTTEKKKLLERYQKKITAMEDKPVSYPDMVYYTVAFARRHGLSGADMEPVIPKDILECSMPTVLDMIDASDDFELE